MDKYAHPVSIGDANRAELALRTHGLTALEAEEVIQQETTIAINMYRIIPTKSLAPELIQIFGAQHINDAIAFVYYYLNEEGVTWNSLKCVINTLIKVYRPEELIRYPDYLRYILAIVEDEEEDNIKSILNELSHDEIKKYCHDREDDFDYDNDN